jgi:hypothetical protein
MNDLRRNFALVKPYIQIRALLIVDCCRLLLIVVERD